MIWPLLAKWHPAVMQHEAQPHADVSKVEHERRWNRAGELRDALEKLRGTLVLYADILAAACEIPSLHSRSHPEA